MNIAGPGKDTVYDLSGCEGSGDQRCGRCNRLECVDNRIRAGMTEAQLRKAAPNLVFVAYLDVDEWYLSTRDPGPGGDSVHEEIPWPSDWPAYVTTEWLRRHGWEIT